MNEHTCEMCGSELYLLNSSFGIDLKINVDIEKFCTVDLYKCKICGRLSYIIKN